MAVNAIPEGYHSITPYLVVDGAAEAIDWYRRALIGDSFLMLSDEWPEMNLRGPKARGGVSASLMLYVPDADLTFERAIREGATEERPVTDQFYGDRSGTLIDPFGHRWTISTHART